MISRPSALLSFALLGCGAPEPEGKPPATTVDTAPATSPPTTTDTGSSQVTDTAPETPPCRYPAVDLPPQAPGGFLMPTPIYMGVRLVGLVEEERLTDFVIPSQGELTTFVEFGFFDLYTNLMCVVAYDASASVPGPYELWETTSGGPLYGGWELFLSNGFTSCGDVDPAFFATNDLREWLERSQWRIAVGEMVTLTELLQSTVEAGGADWTLGWEPYVYSVLTSQDGAPFDEGSYAYSSQRICEEVVESGNYLVTLEKPTAPPISDFVSSAFFLIYPIVYTPPMDTGLTGGDSGDSGRTTSETGTPRETATTIDSG